MKMVTYVKRILFIILQCTWGILPTLVGLFFFLKLNDYPHKTYGHCIQSIVLGPLFVAVGIISLVWGRHPYFVKLREEKKLPYTSCFVESWASKWGELATGEEAIWD